jgi:hypothetical protein
LYRGGCRTGGGGDFRWKVSPRLEYLCHVEGFGFYPLPGLLGKIACLAVDPAHRLFSILFILNLVVKFSFLFN